MRVTYFPNATEKARLEAAARERSAIFNIPLPEALDQVWAGFQLDKADEDDERYDREEGGAR